MVQYLKMMINLLYQVQEKIYGKYHLERKTQMNILYMLQENKFYRMKQDKKQKKINFSLFLLFR